MRGESIGGRGFSAGIHPLLYKHKRGLYRDPLPAIPALFLPCMGSHTGTSEESFFAYTVMFR